MKWFFSQSKELLWHDAEGLFNGWNCQARSEPIEGHTPIEKGIYPFQPSNVTSILPETYELTRAMGPYFVAINEANQKGLHGGGSALQHPLDARQGWCDTEGCIRVQNVDLYHIVRNIAPGDTLEVL